MQKTIFVNEQDMQRIEQQIEHKPTLQEMIAADPEVLSLLKWAASQHSEPNRWRTYEQVKTMSNEIVGWDARTPTLRNSQCYEVFIRAVDALIPDNSELEAS